MIPKWIGAGIILFSCSGYGIVLAAQSRYELHLLKQLRQIISDMSINIQYRLTSLPELCLMVSGECFGTLRFIFRKMSEYLSAQIVPDADAAMRRILEMEIHIPNSVRELLLQAGRSLDQYDLPGQIQSLERLQELIQIQLESSRSTIHDRVRCYRVLGISAGIALTIILL